MKIQLYSVLIITNVELPAGQSCFTHQSSFFTSASCSFSKVAIGHFLLPIFYEKINCLNQYDFFFWYILNSKNTASIFVLLTVIETRFVLQKKYLSSNISKDQSKRKQSWHKNWCQNHTFQNMKSLFVWVFAEAQERRGCKNFYNSRPGVY